MVICKRSPSVQGGDEIIKWGDPHQHIQLHEQQVVEHLSFRRVAASTAETPTFGGAGGSHAPREAGVSPQKSTALVAAPERAAHGDVLQPRGAASTGDSGEINKQ